MAETLWTGHELIIKAYDEVGGELLYSGGFIIEPNDTVEDFLLDNGIILSNVATAEVACAMTQDTFTLSSWTTQTFTQILSGLTFSYTCAQDDADAGKCTLGEQFSWNGTEVPATLVMSIYGVLNKENNQHGAIFTWHSVRDDDYSAMRGPCPKGFHIPTSQERARVTSSGVTLGAWTGSGTMGSAENAAKCSTYLKLPIAGGVGEDGSAFSGSGHYWCCDDSAGGQGRYLLFSNTTSFTVTTYSKARGKPIRPFKDSPVVPDSTRTVLYDGSSMATGMSIYDPGIYYNSSLGLISISSDGETRVTIADKNVGAINIYNYGDTLSDANCGGFFERGNNYMFPYSGPTNISSTQVSTSGYGPGNYYYSDTFIIGSGSSFDWSSPSNRDLRGAITGVKSGYKLLHKEHYIDYSAMRGPCPEGFHIPTYSEWTSTRNTITTTLGIANNPDTLKTYLKIALSSMRGSSGTVSSGYNTCYLWTSSASLGTCVSFRLTASTILSDTTIKIDTMNKNYGYCIRPFKDVPVVPNSTRTVLYNGSSVAEGAGIFWNSTDGLISISGDGVNWTTIADKNLGATVVYNDGDTLTQNNCGGYFQRGNNYMFPFTGSVTTDGTEIDASSYGPGNYYSSNLWKTSACRDTSRNTNLRGATTGVIEGERRVI